MIPLLSLGSVLALGLSGLYLHGRKRAGRAEAEHPAVGAFVDAEGVRLHHLGAGSGPAVVLLHGAGGMLQDFTVSGLHQRIAAAGCRAIAIDRPGYGYSQQPGSGAATPAEQAAIIRAGLHALGVERPVLLGHSWGAALALAYALAWPEELSGILLLSGFTHPAEDGRTALALAALPRLAGGLSSTLMPALTEALAPRIIEAIFAPNPVPEAFRDYPLALSFRPGQIAANATELGAMNRAVAETCPRYGEIRLPASILTGAEDRITAPEHHSRQLRRDLPQAEYTELPGIGHMPHHIATEAVLEAVLRLVRR